MDPNEAITGGLSKGMETLSDLFDEGDVFVPQLLLAAEAFESIQSSLWRGSRISGITKACL